MAARNASKEGEIGPGIGVQRLLFPLSRVRGSGAGWDWGERSSPHGSRLVIKELSVPDAGLG